MRLLVLNDDGIGAAGIAALVEAVEPLGEVWVVAPEHEQSAASHAISLTRPLRIRRLRERWFSVDGTPTDCAYLAIHHLMKDEPPALAVSGINHGPNLADDVVYSGTVAAAMEATLLGVPAIAFSLVARGRPLDFTHAARFARSLVGAALSQTLPPRLLLNVNVPGFIEPRGWAVTRLGRHTYGNQVVENRDPRGRRYYWIGGTEYSHEDLPGSDCNAVLEEQLISVTPVLLDLTDLQRMEELMRWPVDGFQRQGPAKI
ncbi:MAG TPA: 5'/3'-nucleotidase SurE [Myxococcaceae bacterium]|nr:5'/3'-nucleotidase SurE [Myxococcaceae bacterium]